MVFQRVEGYKYIDFFFNSGWHRELLCDDDHGYIGGVCRWMVLAVYGKHFQQERWVLVVGVTGDSRAVLATCSHGTSITGFTVPDILQTVQHQPGHQHQ